MTFVIGRSNLPRTRAGNPGHRLSIQCSELLGDQSLAPRSLALRLYQLHVRDELTTKPWGCKREPQNPKSKSLPILSFLGKGLIFICIIYSLISTRFLVLTSSNSMTYTMLSWARFTTRTCPKTQRRKRCFGRPAKRMQYWVMTGKGKLSPT